MICETCSGPIKKIRQGKPNKFCSTKCRTTAMVTKRVAACAQKSFHKKDGRQWLPDPRTFYIPREPS